MGEMRNDQIATEDLLLGGGVPRRTIVKGAAWSIPVIAVTAAVPGASASVSPLVAVSVAPNAVTSKPNDVLVTREVETTVTVKLADGSPDTTAKVVTVVLGGGLKFADGTTTYTYTGSASSFTIPAANRVTGEKAGSGTITATVTSAATAPSTTLPVTVSPGAFYSVGYQDAFAPHENATAVVGSSGNTTRADKPGIYDSLYPVSNLPAGVTVSRFSQGGWTAQGFAVTTDGGLYGWGRNVYYELGTGANTPHPALSPIEVLPAGSGVVQAESMEDGVIILKSDGAVLTSTGSVRWPEGQGGNGGVQTLTPTPVLTAPGVPLTGIAKIAAGPTNGYALGEDGVLWAWGHGVQGGNGDGSTANNLFAERVVFPTGVSIVDVAAAGVDVNGAASAKAVDADGNVWTWGRGDRNLSGTGSPSQVTTPTMVPGLAGVTKIWGDFTGFAAKNSAGDVYVWGDANVEGAQNMLGLNGASAATPTLNPQLQGADRVVFWQYGGSAIFPDGTVKTWGNSYNGTPGALAVPTTLAGVTNATDIGTYRWGMFVKGDYVSPIPVPARDRGIV
ncbi:MULTISPECIES: RCC1 domain-containing protein [Bacteria]|uniref:RCC1 domain-containing protein n=1 Tax=Bacteria TaxID=2 RepID=UPI003C7C2F75